MLGGFYGHAWLQVVSVHVQELFVEVDGGGESLEDDVAVEAFDVEVLVDGFVVLRKYLKGEHLFDQQSASWEKREEKHVVVLEVREEAEDLRGAEPGAKPAAEQQFW